MISTLTAPLIASIYIRAETATEQAILVLQLAAVNPPALVAALVDNANPTVFTGYKGLVGQVNASGGDGAYTYAIQPVGGNLTVGADGRISLLTAVATPTTLAATLTVDDGHQNTPAVVLNISLAILSPAVVNASGAVLAGYTGVVASVTNVFPASGFSLAVGGDNFILGTDGVLSLTAAIAVSSTLMANIVVDGPPLITLSYTLTIAPCSFFNGCRPFVNYADNFTLWLNNTATLQLLIAAGADVNELYFVSGGNSMNRPLFAALEDGSPAVVSVLLAAGADVNAVGERIVQGGQEFNVGVFYYASQASPGNLLPLARILLEYGADINLIRSRIIISSKELQRRTPVDEFYRQSADSVAAFLIEAGGKCLRDCRLGDIRLASVSFAPATVEVSAPTFRLAAGALYTVRAYSGLGTRFVYDVVSVFPANLSSSFNLLSVDINNAILSLNSALEFESGRTVSVIIEVTDNNPSADKAILQYVHIIPPAPALVNASVFVLTGYTGAVASVAYAPGGEWSLLSGDDNFALGTNGVLSLTAAQNGAATIPARVRVSHEGNPLITLDYTLLVGEELRFTPDKLAATITTSADNRAFLTASAVGPLSAVRYALISVVPANLEDRFTVFADGGVVSVLQPLTTPITLSLYIRASENIGGADRSATLLLTVAAVDPPPLAAAFDDSRPVVLTGHSGLVAQINSSGGLGNYSYGLQDGVGNNASFAIGATDGRLSLTEAQDTPTILTAAATVNDEHPNTPALTLSLTLRVADALVFTPNRADIRITTYQSVPYALHTATTANPSGGEVTYSLLSTFPANFTDNINFTPSDRIVNLIAVQTTPVSASIYIRATTATEQATLVLQLAAVDPPALAATLDNAEPTVFTGYKGPVGQVNASGGAGAYTYAIQPVGGNLTVGADGRISLPAAQATPTTLAATLTVDDEHPNTPAVVLSVTLAVLASPALVGASLLVSPSYTGPVASITNASSGNWTLVAGDNNFTLGADGVLSLTTTIGVASTLTAAIVADELSRLTTLNYTLNVGVCSFYQNGCRPFVNYAGGTGFPWQRNAQLARDLIAAGADVEEIFNDPSDKGSRTPLLYIAQNGSPEVINIFLDNGADINAVGYFQHQQFFSDFTNLGVLFYLSDSSNNSHPQRLSTFVARGVNINLLAKEVSYRGSRTTFSTPLDRYNDRNTYLADFMRAYGAKCFSKCNFGNGDIRLASVSFRPARVGAAAPIYRVAAGNLHTVRAATGLGSRFDYRVVSVIPADLSSSFSLISVDITIARLSLNSALELESGRTVSVIIEATDNNPLGDDTAILQYVHIIPPAPALVNASVFVLTGYTGAVASVAYAPGGEWTLLSGDDNFALGTNGVLSLTAAQNGAATITAGVRVSHDDISPVTLGYTLLVVEQLRFTSAPSVTITTAVDNRAFFTALAVGPLSAVQYARISVVPADLESRFTVFTYSGVVNVLQPLTTPTTLSLYLRASETIGGADRSATLLLT